MTENKAVLLGFCLVAFVMVAAVLLAWIVMSVPPHNTHMDDPVSRAFRSAPNDSDAGVRPARAVEAILPLGMPAAAAIGTLTGEDFRCTRTLQQATCRRHVSFMSAGEDWTVAMTFDASDRLLFRSATCAGQSL